MQLTTIIGIFAATLTTLAFIPQVVQIVKTRNTEGISLGMYVIFTIGIACWFTYGILCNDLPLIISNAITLISASIILFYKVKYG